MSVLRERSRGSRRGDSSERDPCLPEAVPRRQHCPPPPPEPAMRLCRLGPEHSPTVALYDERGIVPLKVAAETYIERTGVWRFLLPDSTDLLDFLPPNGSGLAATRMLADWVAENRDSLPPGAVLDPATAPVLVPIPR